MKKSLLHAVFSALLLAGCAQNEITDISPDAAPPVGFKVFTDAQTRGLITNGSASSANVSTGIQTTGFGVLAYYTGQFPWGVGSIAPNFMYNQKVEYKAGGWTYAPVKYWPNTEGDKISFFAYAPHSTTEKSGIALSAVTKTGSPSIRFTLQAAPADMVDLVATNDKQTGDDKTVDVEKATSTVKFKLNHVLTRASFKAKLDASLGSDPTHVIVTGMRILGTNKRDATNTGNSVAANDKSQFYSEATYWLSGGVWAPTTAGNGDAPKMQADPYELNSIMPLKEQTSISAKYNTKGIELAQAGTATALLNDNQYLFLIPPHDVTTPTGIKEATDVRMQIDYDILTVDGNLADGHSVTSTTATVSLPNGTLKRGEAYNFTFTVGLEKVQVSADVANWATPETSVYVPSADAKNTSEITYAISATLNTAKGNDKNCNYFVINCTGGSYGSINLASATVSNFVSGDRIELNFTAAPGVSGITLPTGWTADKTTLSVVGKIILKKD